MRVLLPAMLCGQASAEMLESLGVDGVQQWLQQTELHPFFGADFEMFRVDGHALKVIKKEHVKEMQEQGHFAKAMPFHWDKLFDLVERDQQQQVVDSELHQRHLSEQTETKSRRQLDDIAFSGLLVKRDNATIRLGVSSDVGLQRSGEGELSLLGRVLVEHDNGNGTLVDVAQTLADLQDTVQNGNCKTGLQAVADLVAINTEMLLNLTQGECSDSSEDSDSLSDTVLYSCLDVMTAGGDSGVYTTEDYGEVYCNNDFSVGGWTLAMNIDTSDSNVVDYQNKQFWESTLALGGASSDVDDALTSDYKNNKVTSNMEVGQIMVVVHEEGTPIGWRAWDMIDATQPLSYYFQGGDDEVNICGASDDSKTNLALNKHVPVTVRSFDAQVGDLIRQEPLVYMDDCQLFANLDVAGTHDFNRLTCIAHPDTNVTGNYGWGLGTLYDAQIDGDGNTVNNVCPTTSKRPLCDAQFHVDQMHWGSFGGLGGMIGTDNNCNNDCPWTMESGYDYDYAIYVRSVEDAVVYDSCEDAMADDAPTGAYLLSTGDWVYCNNDISLGGWTLALNIDTSDGNVVDYQNYDFWESEINLGGAESYAISPFRSDYKNVEAFSSLAAHEILVVLHKQQGEKVLGYRAWTLYNPGEPLSTYFNDGSNVCGTDDEWGTLETNTFNYVTHTCIDSYLSDQVIEEEPLIYHDEYQLYANIETGESNDFNRLTAKDHPEITTDSGNYGWGLGTLYDATHGLDGDKYDYPYCPTETMRPLCDAQFHTTQQHWGSSGGIGGMIGTDHVCNDDCPWTVASGYEWDYSIYVRETEPVYYESCQHVANSSLPSGQYILGNSERVYCYVDDKGDGWTLALNIQTSDGNVVHYSNVDFWEHSSLLGGASDHHSTPFWQDYKNGYAFSEMDASKIMIIVHDGGVRKQENSLGWRSWNTAVEQPLREYFINSNACGLTTGVDGLDSSGYETVTAGVIDGAVYDLIDMEPMVYHDEYELYANVENGNSHDYNRLSSKESADEYDGNKGWGLGTLYDATHIDDDEMTCGPDGSSTARPQCDAQFHAVGGNWGTSSGTGGMIGTDNVCMSNCPWTTESGYYYNYAIFVQ